METNRPQVVFVDVDDTLVRSVGSKRIPMPAVVDHVRQLKRQGAEMYCWSTGGPAYAQEVALELGVADCFRAFLPKPNVMIDDQEVSEWRSCKHLHPSNC